ncbi:LuxR C-terminal-related transcriptional regulator [Serratia marcescens]|uniref:helix-turn-helix transcriptional regulator n=1 Tax=Serratia marcescens TaxID=615 RepID=UPI0022371B7B|nr:LuxR C-terminal-related transcriptional regulator [Serratia marcescens]MCW6016421.1 LuxR C-terminal-related transcriptional regulator [Serratia marcescens]MCW6025654.1 LuxR C-terminal-related transcriptional regulator [Serratia marcescens]
MTRLSRKYDVVALLADEPLVQEGLYHLLKEVAHDVRLLSLSTLRLGLRHAPVFSRIVVAPSSLTLLRMLPVMAHRWAALNKVILCRCDERSLIHKLTREPVPAENTVVLPLDVPLRTLSTSLSRAFNKPLSSPVCPPALTAAQLYADDPLITQLHLLTKAECKVMALLLKGTSPARASDILCRDVRTISTHKLKAMKKLNVSGVVGMHSLMMHPSFLRELNALCLKESVVST